MSTSLKNRIHTLFSRRFWMSLTFLLPGFLTQQAHAELACQPLVLANSQVELPTHHKRGLLWKITRIGLEPSYLFGTMHLPDPEITNLPRVVLEALDNSMSVTLEVKIDPENVADVSKTMNYSDGTKLKEKVGDDLYARTIPLLEKYGYHEAMVQHMKPWAAYLSLSLPPSQGGLPLDMVILKRGMQFKAKIHGLETLEEQLGIFESMQDDEQTQLLQETVCNYKTLQADIQEMKTLYVNRDLAGLAQMPEKYAPQEAGDYEELMQKLIPDRNKRMVDRMQDRLLEGRAFIAVGALHLPGEDGILGLLEAQGYSVTPIY